MKDIPGFPDYIITPMGEIFAKPRLRPHGKFHRGRRIKPQICSGYYRIGLYLNLKRTFHYIHELVLTSFIGPCPKNLQCRHLDGNRLNNKLDNLKWGTAKENAEDRIIHGHVAEGDKNGNVKLNPNKVRVIRYLYRTVKFSLSDIAWQFDVRKSTISSIVNNKTWRYVA